MPEPNAELLRLTAALNRMKPEQQAAVAPEPEPTEESLLSQIGGAGLSAVGAVGNFLDLPASMARDVMAGDNPFDQLLPWNWFSSEGRAGGREMLDRNVATGAFFTPNKETGMSGWIDDPWEGVQDIAGFAAEMALDPLSWWTGGARTAEKLAAKKAAGYADNFAGKLDKFGDTLETLDPGTYVGRAINKQVKNATGYQMDEHLARWFKGGKTRAGRAIQKASEAPLTPESTQLEKAKVAAAKTALFAGRTMTGARLRANKHFEQAVQQRTTATGQTAARYATEASISLQHQANEELTPVLSAMVHELKPHMDQTEVVEFMHKLDRNMREVAEGTMELDVLPEKLQAPMKRFREFRKKMMDEATAAHVVLADLKDDVVFWAPRKASAQYNEMINDTTFKGSRSGKTSGPLAVDSTELEGLRKQLFKDSSTPALNDAMSDANAHAALDKLEKDLETWAADGLEPDVIAANKQAAWDKIADDLQERYGDKISAALKMETEPGSGVFRMVDADGKHVASLKSKELDGLAREVLDDGTEQFTRILPDESEEVIYHEIGNRFEALAKFMYTKPELQDLGGIYTNSLIGDFSDRAHLWSTVTGAAKALKETVHQGFDNGFLSAKPGGRANYRKLGDMFKQDGFTKLDVDSMLKEIADTPEWQARIPEGEDGVAWMKELEVDKKISDDIREGWKLFDGSASGKDGWTSKGLRSFTQLFKAGVLTHPAFHNRNLFSGLIQSMVAGEYSHTAARAAYHMVFKGQDPWIESLPQVKQFMDDHNIDDATEAARQMYAATTGHTSFLHRDLDNLDTTTNPYNDFQSAREALPGGVATGPLDLAKQTLDVAADAPRAWAQYIPGLKNIDALKPKYGLSGNIADIAGVIDLKGVTRQTTGFAPVVASNVMGKHVEEFNRMQVFLENLRKGKDPLEAGAAAKRVQLDYDPKTFTPTEQMLKKVFPFYSFFTREAHWLARELMANPAGKLGKVIRATRLSQDEDTYLPEYVKNQMAIPTSEKDGSKTYLTGIGLMHEDVLTKLAPSSASEGFRNVISQTNPLLKGPLEWAFGRSSFQGGPMGGRDLDSMDPPLGRLMTQLGLQEPTPSGRAAPILGSPALEFLSSNSPASRVVSTLKNVVDHRKTVAERALHTLTGLRFTSITPQQQRSSIRDLTDALANDLGANRFEIMTISDDLIDAAGEGTPEQKKLKAIVELRKLWDRQRKAEKRAKAKEEEN